MRQICWSLLCCVYAQMTIHLSSQNYEYWCHGHCKQDVETFPTAGIVLMGGGTDTDDAFRQQIAWANKGDLLVLRTYGNGAYNKYIYELGDLNSAATLLLKNAQASEEQFVLEKVGTAEAIFFAGGDQSTYVNFWTNTSLQKLLIARVAANVTFGGTSAGCAIEGQFIYTAENDTVTSQDALNNPYQYQVTLGKQFLPLVNVRHFITDPHFVTRDRMGRLLVFVARIIADGWDPDAYGVGIDEKTAVLVNPDGTARLVGQGPNGTAYFIHAAAPETCKNNTPLTWTNIAVTKVLIGGTYDFNTHTSSTGKTYTIQVNNGVISPPNPYSPP